MKNKILKRPYICKTGGVVGPNAICGKVSVASDNKGFRCCAHGNVKCPHKVTTITDEMGTTYELEGQYVDERGNVCFLESVLDNGMFLVHDLQDSWFATTLSMSEFTSGKVTL